MKKQNLLFIFFYMIIANLFAQESVKIYEEYYLGYDNFKFQDTKAYYENITGLRAGNYIYPRNVQFDLKFTKSYLIAKDTENNKEALILKIDDLCIVYYDSENRNINNPFFIGISKPKVMILTGSDIKSSGNYVENGKEYSPNKLNTLTLNSPWVESDLEYGIGEYLEFDLIGFHGEKKFTSSGFYLINGFVSITNQSLYEKNSRIKVIKIIDLDTKEEWTQELQDTPNPQFVDCKGHEGNRIRIVIQEVYPGSLWKDTCVSGIILVK